MRRWPDGDVSTCNHLSKIPRDERAHRTVPQGGAALSTSHRTAANFSKPQATPWTHVQSHPGTKVQSNAQLEHVLTEVEGDARIQLPEE